jgi:hypothetical protein
MLQNADFWTLFRLEHASQHDEDMHRMALWFVLALETMFSWSDGVRYGMFLIFLQYALMMMIPGSHCTCIHCWHLLMHFRRN